MICGTGKVEALRSACGVSRAIPEGIAAIKNQKIITNFSLVAISLIGPIRLIRPMMKKGSSTKYNCPMSGIFIRGLRSP